jgi:small subunit ribosomal protein S11
MANAQDTAKKNTKNAAVDKEKDSGDDKGGKGGKTRKKPKRLVVEGVAHIYASFNNTIVTLTDLQGNAVVWSSAASCGYRGSRKSTPYAAGEAATKVATVGIENFGMKSVHVKTKGPGPGRESAVRALHSAGLKIMSLTDATGIPFNGCRDPKRRRV